MMLYYKQNSHKQCIKTEFLKGFCAHLSNKTCDSCPRCVEEDEYFPENQSSQPVTRSKTEGGAQMIVLQCFTTTRVGLETYPFKSKPLIIRGLRSTHTISKQASGAAHPESSPCIRPKSSPCIQPMHPMRCQKRYFIIFAV